MQHPPAPPNNTHTIANTRSLTNGGHLVAADTQLAANLPVYARVVADFGSSTGLLDVTLQGSTPLTQVQAAAGRHASSHIS